ncbi:UPF0182 family protein [Clostridium fermenticellae]|uniref:UPF0182 protein D4Z93_00075 n=1 Tax=Clostridium fermenticellae TaxID=2068654 RepID=A0A386H085_9CLOT|nr:UPF0182 family protein [Clostridium fermenticellae]AYD39056.1 UPF0182 family protein [Clostridium fermenticellae]
MKFNKRLVIGSVVLLFLVFLLFINRISGFVINIEWYKKLGYLSVYFTKMIAVIKLMIPIFIVAFVAIWIYYKSLNMSIMKYRKVFEVKTKRETVRKRIFFIFDFLVSFIMAYIFSITYWYRILQFTHAVKFDISDPIFHINVSFYVFKLPLLQSLFGGFVSLLVVLVLITLFVYFTLVLTDKVKYSKGFKINPININSLHSGITKFAGKQLAIIASLLMLCVSVGYIFKCLNLVYSTRGVAFGASYTDIHVSLPFFIVISVTSIISSGVIFWSITKSKVKPIFVSIIAIIGLILLENITSLGVQNFIVKSNQKTLEQPYIKYDIDYTRKAFNINKTEVHPFEVKDNLTLKDIESNKDTINNIRINSVNQALEFYNQVQIIRYYYEFNDVDVDRYNIDGKFNQVFIAAREIDTQSVDPNTWQNKHLIYTHGYGIVMNKVNSVTSEGQPDFVIKDIPSQNSTDIKLKNPRIYFGEKTNDYAIVDTNMNEFDYPQGGNNQMNKYDGTAGIKMSFINKLLFAINQKDINFILSRDINSNSKILINRNIVDRAKKIAPFLKYDSNPYIVINNGKLCWILDAYTTSNVYPFSQPQDGVNYIRNSVKVVIDAENGDTNFYIVDKNDPIINSYSKIFPGLFKDTSGLSNDIKQHFKYPQDMFDIQCSVYGKYHMTDPGVFYNGEDLWQVSKNQKQVGGEKNTAESPYVVMKLPGQKSEEMILLQYFNMRNKDNMVALFGAKMDKGNYGKLVVYKFPPQKTIYSPYLFKQNLNQDTTISQQLSLWNKNGSQVQFGDTIIVPINDSLLYVEPMYLRANGKNSIPEVKRVIVSYGNKIVLAENIDSALKQLFNYSTDTDDQNDTDNNQATGNLDSNKQQYIKQAQDLYNKAVDAQKNGDWAKYGEYIKSLGQIIEFLNK